MCTLILLDRVVPQIPVIVAANRDEFFARPAAAPTGFGRNGGRPAFAAPHDLDTDTVPLIDGTRADRRGAGKLAQFAAQPGAQSLADFTAAFPHRLAFKHAHSQHNPEADWGKNTLQAIQFALFAINDRFGAVDTNGVRQNTFTKDKVLVIASAISNGGGAASSCGRESTV